MTRARFSRNLLPLWLTLIAVGTLDIFLMLWTPTGDSYKSPWAVPLVSGFFLMVLAILLLGRSDQSLGRQIQATTSAAPPPSVEATRPSQAIQDVRPVPDFSIDVVTTQTLPTLSPDAAAIVERGRRLYSERLRIYRRGVWLLGLAHLSVALVGRTLDRPYPIPFVVWSWLLVAIAGLIVLCPPIWMRLILVPVAWRILNLACVALTAIVAVLFAMHAIEAGDPRSALLALVMVAAVMGHAWWLRNRNRDLRRKVMADTSLKLVFLWVFGSYTPVFLFLGFAAVWRFLGRMQLLNGAGFMGDMLDIATSFMRGKSRDLVVKTPEELAARIAAFTAVPGGMGMYAHHALLCHDSVWKLALDTVLKASDVLLMDLRGSPESTRVRPTSSASWSIVCLRAASCCSPTTRLTRSSSRRRFAARGRRWRSIHRTGGRRRVRSGSFTWSGRRRSAASSRSSRRLREKATASWRSSASVRPASVDIARRDAEACVDRGAEFWTQGQLAMPAAERVFNQRLRPLRMSDRGLELHNLGFHQSRP